MKYLHGDWQSVCFSSYYISVGKVKTHELYHFLFAQHVLVNRRSSSYLENTQNVNLVVNFVINLKIR